MRTDDRSGFGGRGGHLRLEAFVPPLIRRRIARSPSPPTEPTVERFSGALLLADLSGFSALAESLAQRGPRGAEDLKDLVRVVFGGLVDGVEAHGGEVLKFPGDAVLALWPSDEGDTSAAAYRAAQCALAAQQNLRSIGTSLGVRVELRCGIGAGNVWAASVGGVEGRWEILVRGEPLAQAVQAMSAVNSSEVAVSPAVWERVALHGHATNLADGAIRLESLTVPTLRLPSDPISLDDGAEPFLRAYVPRSVQVRLGAGQTEWLAEFRRVSVLFINLGTLEYAGGEALGSLQRAIVAVQTAVYRYGGSINQVLSDDKTTVIVCGWGLTLHAHGDNEVRAVRAALDLHRELAHIGLGASFGLATGDVFTGLRGNERRCDYAMIGDVVNVAACLMDAADHEILCDFASVAGTGKRIEFKGLAPIRVKGRERPVPVYRPAQLSAGRPPDIVGRTHERQALRERLEALSTGAGGGVVILEGDAGIGKSRLVADLIERAADDGVRALLATADAIERSAPYHVWRAVFDDLLGLEEVAGRGGAERRVLGLLESHTRLLPFAPLLNPVLRLNLRETDQSARVPPRGRAVLTRDLLVHLFRNATRGEPVLLVLEDAHWADSASWALTEAIERELRDVLLLIAMRPLSQEEKPPELLRLSAGEGARVRRLGVLTPDETRALVCQRLRARALSEPVARLIQDKGEGHPFFSEELAYMLRDRNLVEVDEGLCRFTVTTAAHESVRLPNTVHVVVASRIDQLSIPQQLTVKVASVFGRTFDLGGLRAAYPIEVDMREVESHVTALVDRHLVHLAAAQPVPTYAFQHAITQEVAYSLLPFALRRQLHAAVAQWYERQHPDELSPFYPLLAHHWSKAENGERAIFYLDRAGEQARGRNANDEALRFYREAIAIDALFAEQLPSGAPIVLGRRRSVSARDARRIRWERRLGDACLNLGRWSEGRQHFNRALTLTGHPLPASGQGFAIGLATQVLIQCAHRIAPVLFSRYSGEAADLLREAVGAYERVGVISYLHGDTTPPLYSFVAALNVAERLEPTPELALVYSDIGNIFGVVPFPLLARAYHRMAKYTATALNDPAVSTRVLSRMATYRLGLGDWSACRDLEAEMTVSDQIGDSHQWVVSATVRARIAHSRGEFDLAARLAPEIRKRAAIHGASTHEIWGIACQVWALLYLGRHGTLLDLADSGLQLLASAAVNEPVARLELLGAKALLHSYRGELAQARQALEQIVGATAKRPRRFFAELGMSAAAEGYLVLWEAEGTPSDSSEAAARVWQLCRRLDRYARISPPARARAFLWRGCAEWLRGRPKAAHTAWRRCLVEAGRFALPYETARAHYEIGRRLDPADSARRSHLAEAEKGFRRLNAAADLERVVAALRIS